MVPINLSPDTDVAGPTSLDAVNFVTLGAPLPSKHGNVSVETFTLKDGWLSEQNDLSVYFTHDDCDTCASVLKAGECGEGCGGFCVDQEGYLVSSAPLCIFSEYD